MAAADSGATLESPKKRKRRKTAKRRRRSQQQQPETATPLQLQPLSITEAEPESESAPAEGSGFLASVKNLFSSESPNESQKPESVSVSSEPSAKPSATSSPAPSPEIEKQLSSVPDVIGDTAEVGGDLESGEATLGADGISALLEAVAFEEQDVKDTLGELFDWLAETFESEHWKLTERQLRMLGRPSAQLLNSIWGKLKLRIPDILANWCETTPGASAFLMAFGLVVVPKGLKQWQLSKQRARVALPYSASVSTPVTPKPTSPARPDPTPKAAQYATSGALGIPETRGIVGTP